VSDIDAQLLPMALYCENFSEFTFESPMDNHTVPCDLVMQGGDAILDHIIQTSVEEAYYAEYDCEFWDCRKQGDPLFLFSQTAKDYWHAWFWKSLLASLVLAGTLLFFMEKRTNWPFLVGIILVVSGMLFLGLSWIFNAIADWEYAQLFTLFFTKIYVAFLYSFILGILLIGVGIVLKFLKFGSSVSKLFGGKKKVKEKVVVKEVPSSKKETKGSKKPSSSK
jgi:hypothetical protein